MNEYSYEDLLERMTNLSLLAIPPDEGERGGCFSSYDRRSIYKQDEDRYENWDANADHQGFIYSDANGGVALDMEGPGVIWRVWSAMAHEGNICVYIDDMENPAIRMPFRLFFEHFYHMDFISNFPNLMPILSRGRNRWIPIPFNSRCKIVLEEGWGDYYHITYTKFPEGTRLPVYNRELEKEIQIPLAELDRKFHFRGEYPWLYSVKDTMEYLNVFCRAGEETLVFSSDIPGAITKLYINFRTLPEDICARVMRSLLLDIQWDGEAESSVLCPVGDFFGTAPGRNDFNTLPVGMQGGFGFSRWYMPFKSFKITLRNTSRDDIYLPMELTTVKLDREEAEHTMRFHAKWHRDNFLDLDHTKFGKTGDRYPDWPMLLCKGRGRFCGVHLSVKDTWPVPGEKPEEWWYGYINNITVDWWWGEGDEKFFVDGEKFPSTFGTGSEDYIGYSLAAIPPHTMFDSAYACQSVVPIDGNGYTSVARFHICDNIPFSKSFEAYIEKDKENIWGKDCECLYACTAYWYLLHDGTHIDPYNDVGDNNL